MMMTANFFFFGIAFGLRGVESGSMFDTVDKNLYRNETHVANDHALSRGVIGGTFVPVGKYPWFARATYDNDPNQFGGCGGSLVSPSFVVTAAHCFENNPDNFVLQGGYVVGSRCYGSADTQQNNCGQSPYAYRKADKVWTDPNYKFDTGNEDYDFALVRLAQPITNIAPVAMNTIPSIPGNGQEVIGMGFGDTSNIANSPNSRKLLHVTVDAFSNSACAQTTEWDTNQITARMVCAVRPGKDTCKGDSGGPLITTSEPYQLVGLSSFGGDRCADVNFPGVYARVSARVDMMQTYICDNTPTGHPPASFCGGGAPTKAPSPVESSKSPTDSSKSPTDSSKSPSDNTKPPTRSPTNNPTQEPTDEPTEQPTEQPTENPTASPTSVCAPFDKKKTCMQGNCIWKGKSCSSCAGISRGKECKKMSCIWSGKEKSCTSCTGISEKRDCRRKGCVYINKSKVCASCTSLKTAKCKSEDGCYTDPKKKACSSCKSITKKGQCTKNECVWKAGKAGKAGKCS